MARTITRKFHGQPWTRDGEGWILRDPRGSFYMTRTAMPGHTSRGMELVTRWQLFRNFTGEWVPCSLAGYTTATMAASATDNW
jgi:hypothetical protein